MSVLPPTPRLRSRWAVYVGLWLLLSCVFASQLFLAGYVRPWSRAFAAEAVYWLSWGILLPAVFWWCSRLRNHPLAIRGSGLVLGAIIAALLEPLVNQALLFVPAKLNLCAACEAGLSEFSRAWLTQTMRVAGVNLPVYAGFVLAWHAVTYYREARDRQLRSAELESLLHQSQLQALRSQLNPHFLFNSLHSIAELVHTNPKLAEQLIVRLGELLRQVLRTSTQQEMSLAEEVEFIRGYVEIEQLRLGDRLSVTWDIDPAVAQALVPSLILQPLVENAIQHGIAAVARPGALIIRARRDGEFLHLQVSDTGPGIGNAASAPPPGIGLANTQARLARLYGARQRFELRAENGLTVDLRIPLTLP